MIVVFICCFSHRINGAPIHCSWNYQFFEPLLQEYINSHTHNPKLANFKSFVCLRESIWSQPEVCSSKVFCWYLSERKKVDTHHEVCGSKLLSDVCLKKRKYMAGSLQSSCSTTTDCHWLSSSQQLPDCVAPRGTMYVGVLSAIAKEISIRSTGERVLRGSIVVDHCQFGFLPSMQPLQACV